jgi:hypothetical protein
VPEQLLNRPYARTCLQQVGGKRVALQQMVSALNATARVY